MWASHEAVKLKSRARVVSGRCLSPIASSLDALDVSSPAVRAASSRGAMSCSCPLKDLETLGLSSYVPVGVISADCPELDEQTFPFVDNAIHVLSHAPVDSEPPYQHPFVSKSSNIVVESRWFLPGRISPLHALPAK